MMTLFFWVIIIAQMLATISIAKAIVEIVRYCMCYVEVNIPDERIFRQTASIVPANLERDL